MLLILCIFTIASTSSPTESVKIAIFSHCARSHLRFTLSVAKELASRPNAQVKFIVSKECEDIVLNLGFNIEIESIKTGAYALTQKTDLDGFPEYLNLMEKPMLAHYAQAWKQRPHEKPDIIISDFLMIAALDLGELFSIQNIRIFPSTFPYYLWGGRELDNEYISFFTPFFKFLPSDNAAFRTLKYTVKQIMSFMLNRMLVVKRNELRAEYDLDPVSTVGGNGLEFPSFTFFEIKRISDT